jgi:hypothetical protein
MTSSDYDEVLEKAIDKIVAFMTYKGAVDVSESVEFNPMSLRQMILDDLDCFIGEATCDPVEPARFATDKELIVRYAHEVPHHNLEIAALVPLVSPVAPGDLAAIVRELNPGVSDSYESAVPESVDLPGGVCEQLSVVLDDDNDTWVTRRLKFSDVNGENFENIMDEFILLARATCKKIWEFPSQ